MKTILKGKMPQLNATMIVYAQDGTELHFPSDNKSLQIGDLLLLEKENHIPADTKILTGEIKAQNESGEMKVFGPKDIAIGGWFIVEGLAKGYVFAKAEDSLLAIM
ncbi:MAG: hypothetical protein DI598_07595 [Pseudopedobacter saltans]|uniref:P-type ATPase A domain-containing protein n=1 Tax=Pseudopedobacter saltans TaxID=151895 RepID=A0A2W5F401_9SPHI|nr:MAG: hypothetical protein DI598_07595 [Pseudopedobacter saltans]